MKPFLTPLLLLAFALTGHTSFAQLYLQDPAFQPLLVKSNRAQVDQIVVQPDQKILLKPNVDYVNGRPTEGLVRLNADGSIDMTFRIATTVEDYAAIALRPDGKILATGLYAGPASRGQFMINLLNPQGGIDSTYRTDIVCDYPSTQAFALQQDGKILIGANALENGVFQGKVYRLNPNGSPDPAFNPQLLNASWITGIVALEEGKLLVYGDLYESSMPIPTKVLRLNADGSVDTGFRYTSFTRVNTALVQPDGKIMLGLEAMYGNNGSASVVRLNADGTQDNTFLLPTTSNPMNVHALFRQSNGQILAANWFTLPTDGIYGHSRVLRLNTDGSFDPAFDSGEGAEQAITAVAAQSDGKVLAGGTFVSYNGQTRGGLVRLAGDGRVDTAFKTKLETSGGIAAVKKQADGKLLVGGWFNSANDRVQNRLTRLNANGSADSTFRIGSGAQGREIAVHADVRAIGVQADGKILVGGSFASFNGRNTTSLVRLNADGSTSDVFALSNETDYFVQVITIQPDGKILIASATPFNQDPTKVLTRLLPDGTPDPSFNTGTGFDGPVSQVLLQPDGKIIVGGAFTHVNGSAAEGIVRLHPDGTVDASFSAAATGIVVEKAVLQPDGKIIIEGSYQSYQNYLASKVARLNADGTVDEAFKPVLGLNDYVEDICLRPDGHILLSGSFHSPRRTFILLTPDGTENTAFYFFPTEPIPVVTKVIPDGNNLLIAARSTLFRLTRAVPQTLAFDSIPDKMAGEQPFTLSAKASSGLPVTFSVVSGPASVTGNTVTLGGTPGTVTIRASQAGNDDYQPVHAQRSFQVNVALGLETVPDLVRVYPNPASGKFLVEVPAFWQVTDIRLLNVPGKPVRARYTRTAAGYEVQPHVLSPGMYLLHVRSNAGAYVKKVVIR